MGAARNLTRRASGLGVSGTVYECSDKTSCGLPVAGKTMALDDTARVNGIGADFRGRERTLRNTACIVCGHRSTFRDDHEILVALLNVDPGVGTHSGLACEPVARTTN